MHETTDAAPGLRDRKRRETRERMERAAVEIVLTQGLDHLTIDGISERANVSPRTFFNYFDSKEDAILGLQITDDTEHLIEQAMEEIHPATLLDGVMQLLVSLFDTATHDAQLHEQRKRIMREHPELLHRHFSQTGRMLGSLTQAVHALSTRLEDPQAKRVDSDAQAHIVLFVCGAALRSAMTELTQDHPAHPSESFTAQVGTRATTLVREAIETLR